MMEPSPVEQTNNFRRIVRPLIVLGAPRSGTTILMRCLALHPDLWHLPGESHAVLEGPFHPAHRGYDSNRVAASDLDPALAEDLRGRFYQGAVNLNEFLADPDSILRQSSLFGRAVGKLAMRFVGELTRLKKPAAVRLLEKTPKNMLRVPMLEALFPDASYIWLKRRAADNIDSLIEGWRASDRIGPLQRRRYAQAGYPIAEQLGLQDYQDRWWKFALVPGWRGMKGKTLADVAAWQYYQCNRYALIDLAALDSRRVFSVRHEEFVSRPLDFVRRIFEWADLPPSPAAEQFARIFPRVNEVAPAAGRPKNGLRYAEAVYGAIQRAPEIQELEKMMGYSSYY